MSRSIAYLDYPRFQLALLYSSSRSLTNSHGEYQSLKEPRSRTLGTVSMHSWIALHYAQDSIKASFNCVLRSFIAPGPSGSSYRLLSRLQQRESLLSTAILLAGPVGTYFAFGFIHAAIDFTRALVSGRRFSIPP